MLICILIGAILGGVAVAYALTTKQANAILSDVRREMVAAALKDGTWGRW